MHTMFVLYLLVAVLHDRVTASTPPRLLIVSFDGFRHDYVNTSNTPHLMALREKATWADRMVNIFPTKTFPNHQAIATGVYADKHGVIGSRYEEGGKVIGYSQAMFDYSADVMPIWIANEREGGVSGSMMWLGGEFNYHGTRATHYKPLDRNTPWHQKVETVITWFQNSSKPANLVMMYFDQPDRSSHELGATSSQTFSQIALVDNIVDYLDRRLQESGLHDVNVFLLSDHGMVDVPYDHVLNVTPEKNSRLEAVKDLYHIVGGSPILQVIPVAGKELIVFEAWRALAEELGGHFQVYLKSTLPPRWRMANCTRNPEILVVGDLGYGFQDLFEEYHLVPGHVLGVHGFDNRHEEMSPMFMAWGPQIRADYKISSFNNVDLYQLWCTMLGCTHNTVNGDGDFERVSAMWKSSRGSAAVCPSVFTVSVMIIVLAAITRE